MTAWDGVRALSVAAVMAFHHWPDVVPGGFIGVTTFLVLAGVLAIVRIGGELTTTGRFDWRAYAQGRIRRLLPALLFYAGVVLAWTYATRPEIYAAITADAAAALVYITPWREMVGSVTYESAFDTTPAPFVHTWSLGVEELAWVLTGLSIAVLRRVWVAVAATTIAGVVGYAMWFGSSDIYYSPARLAEFAIGAAIGLLILRRSVSVPWPIAGLCIVTLGGWAASWTVRDAYSGRLLAAAAVSAVLVAGCLNGPIARLLSIGPLRWVGTRSYSLYLWHVGVAELTELPSVAAIAVTGALAEVSFRVVENPIRVRAVLRRRAIGILWAVTMALVGVVVLGPRPDVVTSQAAAAEIIRSAAPTGLDDNPPGGRSGTAPAPALPTELSETPAAQIASPSPAVAPPVAPPAWTIVRRPHSITVVGDSTGFRLSDALVVWGARYGITVENAAMGGCSPAALEWELRLGHPDLPVIPANSTCTPVVELIEAGEIVIVSYQGILAMEHRRPGGDWTTIDREPRLSWAIEQGLSATAEVATGQVLYLSLPEPLLEAISFSAVEAANRALADVAARFDNATLVDASPIDADPDRYPRTDAMHLDPEGVAAFVVDILEPELTVTDLVPGGGP